MPSEVQYLVLYQVSITNVLLPRADCGTNAGTLRRPFNNPLQAYVMMDEPKRDVRGGGEGSTKIMHRPGGLMTWYLHWVRDLRCD